MALARLEEGSDNGPIEHHLMDVMDGEEQVDSHRLADLPEPYAGAWGCPSSLIVYMPSDSFESCQERHA